MKFPLQHSQARAVAPSPGTKTEGTPVPCECPKSPLSQESGATSSGIPDEVPCPAATLWAVHPGSPRETQGPP